MMINPDLHLPLKERINEYQKKKDNLEIKTKLLTFKNKTALIASNL